MSRNFEVLSRMEEEQSSLAIDSPLSVPSLAKHEHSKATSCHADNGSRTEVLNLVHTLFLSSPNAPRQVLFCGVGEGNSSGNVCVSAAKVLAGEVSSRVCAVDAKLRAPSLHNWLDPDGSGFTLSNPLQGGSLAKEISENLWFVSAESLQPTAGAGGEAERLCSIIRELRNEFGYVLIDAPPAGRYTDATVLGQVTDGVVLVLEANATRRVAALNGKAMLESSNVRVLGTVLSNRTFPIPEKIYRKL